MDIGDYVRLYFDQTENLVRAGTDKNVFYILKIICIEPFNFGAINYYFALPHPSMCPSWTLKLKDYHYHNMNVDRQRYSDVRVRTFSQSTLQRLGYL